ncbi:hypothetical protein GCM10022222_45730 [Amycolatopsis ultiminotia]|uniref:HTH tetR-type domain-containing protein n=1 Tax=Amycolatopsis ultiminotia TaxID=543629 RepID=A0ABP6WXF7_9PSEU
MLAEDGDTEVSIQAITDRADVGFGSFYNHFSSKAKLFTAAVTDAFDRYGAWLAQRTVHEPDPVTRLAIRIRFTGRNRREQARMADAVARYTLRMLGVREDRIEELSARPLPLVGSEPESSSR